MTSKKSGVPKYTRSGDIKRNNSILELLENLKQQHGKEAFNSLSRKYIYGVISNNTGLSTKTIERILNHYKIQKDKLGE